MKRTLPLACLTLALLGGCQSSAEQLLAQGYPAAFADGFQAGCSSGREAAGATGHFGKDVPRYLAQAEYAQGWDDGFRQCQANVQSRMHRERWQGWLEERDRDWRHEQDQRRAKAFHGS